jgi:hypothetical protein
MISEDNRRAGQANSGTAEYWAIVRILRARLWISTAHQKAKAAATAPTVSRRARGQKQLA